MATKKSETAKANIDLKKGTIQLEGPQEFVEKYLMPILKTNKPFSKAFPKAKPTKREKEIIILEDSTTRVYFSFLLGLIAASLTSFRLGGVSGAFCVSLILTIVVSAILFYIIFLKKWRWNRERIVNCFSKMKIQMSYMSWSLGFAAIGISLINFWQNDIARIICGIITVVISIGLIIRGVVKTQDAFLTPHNDK
jgi:hypothetical protein